MFSTVFALIAEGDLYCSRNWNIMVTFVDINRRHGCSSEEILWPYGNDGLRYSLPMNKATRKNVKCLTIEKKSGTKQVCVF
jgi:hypothetical protein